MLEMLDTPMAIFQVVGSIVILAVAAYYYIKAMKHDFDLVEEITTKDGRKILRNLETKKIVKRK
jgi:hypothetical protein